MDREGCEEDFEVVWILSSDNWKGGLMGSVKGAVIVSPFEGRVRRSSNLDFPEAQNTYDQRCTPQILSQVSSSRMKLSTTCSSPPIGRLPLTSASSVRE